MSNANRQPPLEPLLPLLDDNDAEVRGQAAKVLGERRFIQSLRRTHQIVERFESARPVLRPR